MSSLESSPEQISNNNNKDLLALALKTELAKGKLSIAVERFNNAVLLEQINTFLEKNLGKLPEISMPNLENSNLEQEKIQAIKTRVRAILILLNLLDNSNCQVDHGQTLRMLIRDLAIEPKMIEFLGLLMPDFLDKQPKEVFIAMMRKLLAVNILDHVNRKTKTTYTDFPNTEDTTAIILNAVLTKQEAEIIQVRHIPEKNKQGELINLGIDLFSKKLYVFDYKKNRRGLSENIVGILKQVQEPITIQQLLNFLGLGSNIQNLNQEFLTLIVEFIKDYKTKTGSKTGSWTYKANNFEIPQKLQTPKTKNQKPDWL
ncbi:hypothetical protein GYA19_01050 [Candidatus Beckwithbacteria bacterium]|nr:hypothetical protein [Candidatus Beckwithbacteria bacterium]